MSSQYAGVILELFISEDLNYFFSEGGGEEFNINEIKIIFEIILTFV